MPLTEILDVRTSRPFSGGASIPAAIAIYSTNTVSDWIRVQVVILVEGRRCVFDEERKLDDPSDAIEVAARIARAVLLDDETRTFPSRQSDPVDVWDSAELCWWRFLE